MIAKYPKMKQIGKCGDEWRPTGVDEPSGRDIENLCDSYVKLNAMPPGKC